MSRSVIEWSVRHTTGGQQQRKWIRVKTTTGEYLVLYASPDTTQGTTWMYSEGGHWIAWVDYAGDAVLELYNDQTSPPVASYVIRIPLFADDVVHTHVERTIRAQHTFNPSTVGAPFLLGANASGQMVAGLNVEAVGGVSAGLLAGEWLFHGYKTVDTSVSSANVPVRIPLEVRPRDPLGKWDATNHVWVVPYSGDYLVAAGIIYMPSAHLGNHFSVGIWYGDSANNTLGTAILYEGTLAQTVTDNGTGHTHTVDNTDIQRLRWMFDVRGLSAGYRIAIYGKTQSTTYAYVVRAYTQLYIIRLS